MATGEWLKHKCHVHDMYRHANRECMHRPAVGRGAIEGTLKLLVTTRQRTLKQEVQGLCPPVRPPPPESNQNTGSGDFVSCLYCSVFCFFFL